MKYVYKCIIMRNTMIIKKYFLSVALVISLFLYLIPLSTYAASNNIPLNTVAVGTLGGAVQSGNVTVSFPSHVFPVSENVTLSPVGNSFLPEAVPYIVESFSISIGSDGPLNSRDLTLPREIQVQVTHVRAEYIYIWDSIRNRWFLLTNVQYKNNTVTGYTFMRGGTFIATSQQLSSSFASNSPISASTNSNNVPIYDGFGSIIKYTAIVVVIFAIIGFFYFRKRKN